ncbi:MAG: radical SAM protein [bacterium]
MSSIIFGPVPSRRLGRSLGVDLVPYKTCTFDCVYCELGPTTCHIRTRRSYTPVDVLCDELGERLQQLKGAVDIVTLAGSGEPTLNADLGVIIERIRGMTDRPLGILTNSSLLSDKTVRDALRPLDLVVPSLDAVSDRIFQQINRPVEGIGIEEILHGLIRLREEFTGEIWLEVLVCQGINDDESELARIKEASDSIHPDRIHVNTVFRPPSVEGVRAVSPDRLEEIAAFMGKNAQAVGAARTREGAAAGSRSVRTRLTTLLRRRPCTSDDIASALCIARIEALKLVEQMVVEGAVERIEHQGTTYYRAPIPDGI